MTLMTCFISTGLEASSAGGNSGRSEVDRLWKEYEKACENDLPQTQITVLKKLKSTAKAKGLNYDYYLSSVRYVNAEAGRNWKVRESLSAEMNEEFISYGDPVILYNAGIGVNLSDAASAEEFLSKWEKKLKVSKSTDFWEKAPVGYKNNVLSNYIGSDYEYLLLKMVFTQSLYNSQGYTSLTDRLKQNYTVSNGTAYPVLALGELWALECAGTVDLSAYIKKYDGKAVSTLARLYSLSSRLSALVAKGAGSQDYKEFRNECEMLIKEKKAYSGEEALILKDENAADEMISLLEKSDLTAQVKENDVKASLRNLPEVTFSLYEGEDLDVRKLTKKDTPVFSKVLKNDKCSFYALDSVQTTLPSLPDGEYLAVFKAKNPKASAAEKLSGKDEIVQSCTLSRHSLALSVNRSKEGWLLYAAERRSGKPVEKVTVNIFSWYNNTLLSKEVTLNGATLLDSEIQKVIETVQGRCNIVCSTTDSKGMKRSSETLSLYNYSSASTKDISAQALILTDRSAYLPGETLHFKAILYKDFLQGKMSTLPSGETATVRLIDAEYNEVQSQSLSTNEFGSIAGEFSLPQGRRNGTWKVSVEYGGSTLNAKWFTLDEFQLPTFSIEFNSDRTKYFPGETIPVSGQVLSYAGNNLSDASAEYSVKIWGKTISNGKLSIDDEGRFTIPVATSEGSGHYSVCVKVTDGAGQSIEEEKWLRVSSGFEIEVKLSEKAEGSFADGGDSSEDEWSYWRYSSERTSAILKNDSAEFHVRLLSDEKEFDGQVQWTLYSGVPSDGKEGASDGAKELKSGKVQSGESFKIDFSPIASGLYTVQFKKTLEYTNASGKAETVEKTFNYTLLKLQESDRVLSAEVENAFRVIDADGEIGVLFGAGKGTVWANVLVFDSAEHLLVNENVNLSGKAGEKGSLRRLSWKFAKEWTNNVILKIEYFKDGQYRSFSYEFKRSEAEYALPLSISTFSSSCLPGTQYTVKVSSLKDAEVLAAVFDKSSEDISPNIWNTVSPKTRSLRITSENVTGSDFSGNAGYLDYSLGNPRMHLMSKSSSIATASLMSTDSAENVILCESAVAPGSASLEEEESTGATIKVRQDFQTTLSFQPLIRTAEDGTAELTFTTSDRLSTYILSLFAHDKEFRNATLREEFIVSQPVTITVHEPSALYGGDRYAFRPSVSNNSGKAISGTLTVYIYDGDASSEGSAPLLVQSCPLTLDAGKAETKEFSVYVTEANKMASYSAGKAQMSFKAVFRGKDSKGCEIGDALLVKIPVLDGKQRLTEAHSALYKAGMDKEGLIKSLEKQFVNTTAFGALQKEKSISEMIDDVLAQKTEIGSQNALDLSEVLYARAVSGEGDVMDCLQTLLECRNEDGGFGWFSGMSSSTSISAIVLERLALLRSEGLLPRGADWRSIFIDGVKYIDAQMFTQRDGRHWYCGLSIGEYFYLRSLFPEIAVDTDALKAKVGKDSYKKTLKEIKAYVQSSAKEDSLNGQVLEKTRRSLSILNILSASSDKFDSSLGLKCSKMKRTLSRSIASLKEYAVEHPSGGYYFPNAVMPFRALLSSEAYTHALLCNLFSAWSAYLKSTKGEGDSRAEEIADGVRLWLMVQKETQEWEKNFEFVNAVSAVRKGSAALMQTSVISLSKTYEKPFEEIKAAGNGFSIERKFFVEELSPSTRKGEEGLKKTKRRELREGETLKVGDKVIAVYNIHSDENRSLVHLRTPFNACLRPVRQLSGSYGYALGAWRVNAALNGFHAWWITPQGYREVHSGSIDYWFDVYPEENTTVEDTFYVSQAGVFTAPVSEIESLYAPHYRANASYGGTLTVTE